LQILGYYNSGIDGVLGSGSRRAISAFQEAIRQPATGYLSYHDRVELALAAADEAARRAEAAAQQALAAVSAPNAEEQISDDGNTYRGDRNREGYGVYEWVGGHRYEGQWNVTRQGFGILTLANGWRFVGQWDDSKFTGFGVATGPDGGVMAGEWSAPPGTSMLEGLNGYGLVSGADGEDRGLFENSTLQPWTR
jgi:peptidoglycan hydrolase-like protein with peptidoglycan-binding domain